MSVQRDRRLEELLSVAIEVPPEARRQVLEEAETDRVLVEEVLDLLAAEDEGFMAEAPWRITVDPDASTATDAPEFDGYSIRGLLGEGGMGRVFLALEESTHRLVAIKMIRMPVPDPDLVRRFDAERQALSRLNHPAVAQLFGAGIAGDGRHFVVMEYVDGRPITEYCDDYELGLEARIDLFVAVCRGVEHAHRRQLLHRDLKPSNLLITARDSEPRPKIIDFGIAQGLDGSLGGSDNVTGAIPIGTPAYMSPEALVLCDRRDLDTRTDVYSLGVVLYELLTGTRPEDNPSGDLTGWRAKARDEPMRPSRRVRSLEPDRLRSVAQTRGLDARRLDRRLRGDLDWIVLRALAVDREERYGSAAALADDLERMLRHEPVTARPASLPDRVAKLARRYRLAAGLAVLTVVAISLAAIFSSLALVRTQQAEAEAQRAETEARAEAAAARQTMDFLVGLFEAAKPEEDHGEEVSARTLVARGVETLRGDDLPPLQRARLLHTLGDVQMRLGDYDSGRELAYEALEIRESQLAGEHPEILETLDLLSSLERRAGRLDEAEELVERVVRAREASGEAAPLGDALNTLANLRWRQDRDGEAEELHRRALDLRRAARDAARETGTTEPALESAVAASLNNLGVILWTQKRYDEAEPILREAAEDYERRLGSEHPRFADALGNVGLVLRSSGRVAEAAELHRRVLAIRLRTQGPDHPETATAQDGLARALELLEEYREAEALYLQSLATRREALGERHSLTIQAARHLVRLYGKSGRHEDAERLEREIQAILEGAD